MRVTVEDLQRNWIPIAKVIKPHGVRGEVKTKFFSDDEKLLENLGEGVLFREKDNLIVNIRIKGLKETPKGYIVAFEGFNDIGNAERIRNSVLYINKDQLPLTENDEFYFFQLMDCEVYDNNGSSVGIVSDIIETGANEVLVVTRQTSRFSSVEELIPFTKEFVKDIDLCKKRIVAKKPIYEELPPDGK
ncbi:MAG: ribosome maturation factor RimM [Kosmotogaceae bacterium]